MVSVVIRHDTAMCVVAVISSSVAGVKMDDGKQVAGCMVSNHIAGGVKCQWTKRKLSGKN
jgi:hypothetical protein